MNVSIGKGLRRHGGEIIDWFRRGDWHRSDEGIILRNRAVIRGTYYDGRNGNPDTVQASPNLLPTAGILSILNIAFGSTSKHTAFYFALFSGAVDPAATWTGANFATNASEITSTSEGYTETTRPEWEPDAAESTTPAPAGLINNDTNKASFTIATASTLTVTGGALIANDNTRGGTTGVLMSATRWATARVYNDAETVNLAYEISLSDS